MRRILHISDLHFGRSDQRVVEALVDAAEALAPDVVAVSGDLTQRARRHEFQEAAAFLQRLPGPHVVVPGNHDVPLYNVAARFLSPLGGFRRYVTAEPLPLVADAEIAVVGVCSARSFTFSGGRLGRTQLDRLEARLAEAPASAVRVLVTHHPVDLQATRGRAGARPQHVAAPELSALGIEVILSGHLHASTAEGRPVRPLGAGAEARHTLVISAGTATSTRRRNETNAFNVIEVQAPGLTVEQRLWDEAAGRFTSGWRRSFRHGAGGWRESPLL